MRLLLDASLFGGWGGVLAATAFFLIFLAVAYVAFKMLKRTVKFAFRVAIVVIILMIALAGSIALWAVSSSKPAAPAPPSRSR